MNIASATAQYSRGLYTLMATLLLWFIIVTQFLKATDFNDYVTIFKLHLGLGQMFTVAQQIMLAFYVF